MYRIGVAAAVMVFLTVATGAIRIGATEDLFVKPLKTWDLYSTAPDSPIPRTKVEVPCTVAGGLVDAGAFPFDPFYGRNMFKFNKDDFAMPWNYQYTLSFDQDDPIVAGSRFVLQFLGINYKATLYVNGQRVATDDTLISPFREFEFDVTPLINVTGDNTIVVTVIRMRDDPHNWRNLYPDLGISFYDWSTHPPDLSMGLWRPVNLLILNPTELSTTKGLVVDTKVARYELDSPDYTAYLNASFVVRSWKTGVTKNVWIDLGIPGVPKLQKTVVLNSFEQRVYFTWMEYPSLTIQKAKLWWPFQMGDQQLYTAQVGVGNLRSTQQKFGLRQSSTDTTQGGALKILINHVYVQFRAGGWAPDLFLRNNVSRLAKEFALIQDIGMNGIRLEGQTLWDEFYEMADEAGLLIIPGIGCCDGWQEWTTWQRIQYEAANSTIKNIARRLGHHPSVIGFFESSDSLPPDAVEKMYNDAFKLEAWPNFYISSASQEVSNITGNPGVKMVGPYAWVPPSYWLLDGSGNAPATGGHWKGNYGGAWGFLTEGGPGGAPMTMNSWKRTVPQENLWGPEKAMSPWWNAHCGMEWGDFRNLTYFDAALNARYGEGKSAEDYLYKSQGAAMESMRSYFESYSRNKHINATGFVNWMMNNAQPEHIWHMYDWYLIGGGGYYGAKLALEPLHVMWSMNDGAVWMTSNQYVDVTEKITVNAEIVDINADVKWTESREVNGFPADGSTPLGMVVPLRPEGFGPTDTFFVRLTWTWGNNTRESWYWYSLTADVLNWADSTTFITMCTQWANFQQLQSLPAVALEVSSTPNAVEQKIDVTIKSPAGAGTVAFLIEAAAESKANGWNVPAQLWSDNYISLMPGQARTITVDLSNSEVSVNDVNIKVQSWNNVVGLGRK